MSPSTRASAPNAGFTLLEVLVALALLAGSLAAIGAVVANNARATRSIDQRLALMETARAVLAALPARDELVPGSTNGEIAGHRWRVDVQPLAIAAGDPRRPPPWQPQGITVRVEAPSGQLVRLDTVRLRHGPGGGRP
ncbi:MAG: prepilin-type N-terminal cleavage/methylation domain-containing protein [Xanthobacteraceae bacterium]